MRAAPADTMRETRSPSTETSDVSSSPKRSPRCTFEEPRDGQEHERRTERGERDDAGRKAAPHGGRKPASWSTDCPGPRT